MMDRHGREIEHDRLHPSPGTGGHVGVRAASVAGAVVAALVAGLGSAPYPAQAIVASAASCAVLAVLLRATDASRSDWFTVRVLLALNLIVFGISYAHRLDLALSVAAVAFGLLLLSLTIRAELTGRLQDHANAEDT